MSDPLLTRLVVPVANEEDMKTTAKALASHLSDDTERLLIVHVIEKAGGYMDKAPLEAREEQAERIFEIAADYLGDRPGFETRLQYGTDIVDEIFAVAADIDATTIAFTPRKSNRLTRFLSGDDEHRLITDSSWPVVTFAEDQDGYQHMNES